MSLLNKIFLTLFLSISTLHAQEGILKIGDQITKVDWQTFTSKENGFSVDLPAKPDHVQQKIDIPQTDLSIRYDTYISEPTDAAVYVVSVWYYPQAIDMSKPEVNLKDGFEGMLAALPGSKVEKMEMSTIDKFKALDFLVKHEDIYFQGKLILVYNTLYQVFTVYKDNVDMKEDYVRFAKSFKLVDAENNKTTPSKDNSKKMNVMLEKM